jgi:hypothetical protein
VTELDAIVLAEGELADVVIAGLSARERGVRVARRAGATRVIVVGDAAARADLTAWHGDSRAPLLVIRADQLVHPPLVQPLIAALASSPAPALIAEDPDHAYAGAFVVREAGPAIAALAAGATDRAVVDGLDATPIPHGAIARHAIATPAERRAAHALLYQILIKPQDNAITRYLYRPISRPLTRLLAHTPITPNQISYAVAVLVAIGCWLTAQPGHTGAIVGSVVILAASYLDCCDGEIARLKLTASRFGAWLDTIVDELSSVGYTAALGWHCHLIYGPRYFGALPFDPWLVGLAASVIGYAIAIYCIYYNIIVGVGSANSQDYAGRFEIVPTGVPNHVKLRPAPSAIAPVRQLPPALRWLATYLPYAVRRDFIAWGSVALAAFHLTQIAFLTFVAGAIVTAAITAIDHVKLRALRRAVARSGQVLIAP